MYLASTVHFDVDGWFAGIYLDEGWFGGMEKPNEVKAGLGQGTSNGKPPTEAVFYEIERPTNILGVVDAERDDLLQIVEL